MLQILIRHGESLSNREGRVQGQADVKLSDTGRQQAAAVASWCQSQSFQNQSCELWSSPLCRARETAEEIGKVTGLAVQVADELVELNAGVFQGHLWDCLLYTSPSPRDS